LTRQGSSEVLIVGAGPAGCAAGIVLARAGVEVCIVDRAHFPREKCCGDSISHGARQLIIELGAGELVAGRPHALVKQACAEFPDGSRITRCYDYPTYIIPRYTLDDCLRTTLEKSGATLFQDCRVTSLRQSDGAIQGADGPDLSWSAKLVIAAHGYGTLAFSGLQPQASRSRRLALAATAYFRGLVSPHGTEVADHFLDRELAHGYGWIFPAVDGVSNAGIYIQDDAYQQTGKNIRELFTRFKERHAPRFRGAEQVSELRVGALPLAPGPFPVALPGLLLTGDAAGCADPLSGEGIWQALFTGRLAGEIARDAIAGGGLGQALITRYRLVIARKIGWPSRARAALQRVLALIVERELYRSSWIKSALAWGYTRGILEGSKGRCENHGSTARS
jgi:menaquinone-9 beta-reductase